MQAGACGATERRLQTHLQAGQPCQVGCLAGGWRLGAQALPPRQCQLPSPAGLAGPTLGSLLLKRVERQPCRCISLRQSGTVQIVA